ncbi:MAG: hypothetical protein FWD03_02230 [Defluviitaleaceae bacterium]|nr:hypothetical protein [Defluviitaleaceae bacterium]
MLEAILIVREGIIKYYKKFEPVITVLLRFVLGFYIFSLIHEIGFIRPELVGYYNQLPLTILLGIAFAVLPLSLAYLLMIVDITIHYSYNIEVAAVIFVFLICVLLFYARMAAKESILIVLTVLAFRFNMQFLIPIIAGLYFSATAIVPISIGIFIASFSAEIAPIIATTSSTVTADLELADMITELPDAFGDIYSAFVNALANTREDWIFMAFIFTMAVLLVYVVSRMAIDFAKEIAIAFGCAVIIFGYILGNLVGAVNVELSHVIMWTLIGGLIAEFIRLFDPVLDYQRAESVQFEDDNSYYYVRVVPKIRLTRPKRIVRRIRSTPEEDEA